jgi:isopenicillin-N N-acyltransferase like protein
MSDSPQASVGAADRRLVLNFQSFHHRSILDLVSLSSLPFLHLSGPPRAQGRQHGETLRTSISDVRLRWRESLTQRFGVHPDSFIEAFLAQTRFVAAMRRWTPGLLEEVEGIAEGSGRSLTETLAFQFMDEEWWFGARHYRQPSAGPNHCSIIASRGCEGQAPILAQNMDLRAYLDGGQAVISTAIDGRPRTMVMTICGMIGLCGANEAGVGVAVNTLWQLPSAADGLPVACVVREILEQPDLAAATKWICQPRHASGQHYLIGDQGGFASFEASATEVSNILWEDSPAFVHTNHSVAAPPNERLKKAEEDSRERYSTLCTLMAAKTPTLDEVKAALSSREGLHPISVRPSPDDVTGTMTFASILIELKRPPTIQLAGGPPCLNAYCPIGW